MSERASIPIGVCADSYSFVFSEDFDASFICKWQAAAYIENCNACLKALR